MLPPLASANVAQRRFMSATADETTSLSNAKAVRRSLAKHAGLVSRK
jgi:hypothetical protein